MNNSSGGTDAAAVHDSFSGDTSSAEAYLRARRQHLRELPYGPFGEVMNLALLETRTAAGVDSLRFAEIAESTPLMLPLLLAVHPGFRTTRLLDRAQEILPEA